MGATTEMYDSLQRELSFEVRCLNWPEYQGETTFREIAGRIIAENQISSGDVVGGSSLGGMIALEIAVMVNSRAVVLIGSALNSDEVNPLLSMLSPLASITPFSLIQTLAGKDDHILSRMFASSDSEFIRAMCKYIPSWPEYSGPPEIVHRIHGKKDHLIKCPQSNCQITENAGHLLAITHPKDCAGFLETVKKT